MMTRAELSEAEPMHGAYRGHDTFLPYVLNRTTSALNADFQLVLRDHGMTLLHWRVLAFLSDIEGLGVSALANVTGADQTTLSRALAVMVRAGYVVREPDPQDQRAVAIKLEKKGRDLFLKVLPIAWRLHERAIRGLSPEDQSTLNRILNQIRDNVLNT